MGVLLGLRLMCIFTCGVWEFIPPFFFSYTLCVVVVVVRMCWVDGVRFFVVRLAQRLSLDRSGPRAMAVTVAMGKSHRKLFLARLSWQLADYTSTT